jgi:hypothetical protein
MRSYCNCAGYLQWKLRNWHISVNVQRETSQKEKEVHVHLGLCVEGQIWKAYGRGVDGVPEEKKTYNFDIKKIEPPRFQEVGTRICPLPLY